jgi:HlyD family secretion protein
MDRRIVRWTLAVVVLAAIAFGVWWWLSRTRAPTELTLYGNVDLRQVDLAFNNSERVTQVLAQEGDKVRRGQVLARLDTSRLGPQLAQVQAAADAQQQAVERLRRGNRPQEIEQSRANLAQARADAANAAAKYQRVQALWDSSQGKAMSRQDLDDARTSADSAQAKAVAAAKALELEVLGPRKEDVAQAEAQLRGDRAQAALLQRQLADTTLVAPLDAVVRSRILEPGEMASPAKPAFSLAIVDPKWVRAYVSGADLGFVRPGQRATISVDSFPHRGFQGWVGFISPVAEFTPKSVQTTELRSSLVYEVRVFVNDPRDELRLGMPATVRLPLPVEARK